ncbi:hypothetical protein DFH09DRAFT_910503 [Mycena vulgaris]|nr:hypothetical protein DFH09DRAFT_910503 [Mycena vulgaris]
MLSSRHVFTRVCILHARHVATRPAVFPFPTTPNPTPHQIFHLPRDASQADVKARYFNLVRIYHPDKADPSVPSDVAHARFQAIATAYNALRTNSPSAPDKANTATPAARAMYKRSRNLYSGPQLADESWKDRIIVAGVIFVRLLAVLHPAATRRVFLAEAMDRPSHTALPQDARLTEQDARLAETDS